MEGANGSSMTLITANEFVEQEIDKRAEALEDRFQADVLAFSGPLLSGADDVLRDVIEAREAEREKLCVVLTTPGGYIDVVHRIVDLLRHHYAHVEFVVPNYAFSAGTILAMSGDAIWMDYYSRLGPIDPQVEIDGQMLPALGYLVRYERLIEKAQNGELTTVEAELVISGFDQAELYAYEQARELSVYLLKLWLANYKFRNWEITETSQEEVTQEMREERAEFIARELSDTEKWHSHGHGISMEVLRRDLNLKIDDFGADRDLNARVSAYYKLLDDYQKKLRVEAIHARGRFTPIHARG